jgi:hypothetical protein
MIDLRQSIEGIILLTILYLFLRFIIGSKDNLSVISTAIVGFGVFYYQMDGTLISEVISRVNITSEAERVLSWYLYFGVFLTLVGIFGRGEKEILGQILGSFILFTLLVIGIGGKVPLLFFFVVYGFWAFIMNITDLRTPHSYSRGVI